MIPTNSFSPNGASHLDSRLCLLIGGAFFIGLLTYRGDQVVFENAPKDSFDIYLSYLPATIYLFCNDRVWADGISAGIYAIFLLVIGISTFNFFLQKCIEPIMIKKMIQSKRRERANLMRYGDDTF